MSQAARRKDLALGTDIGNACQLMSTPLDGRFRGQSGGEALLGWQTGWYKHAYSLKILYKSSKHPGCTSRYLADIIWLIIELQENEKAYTLFPSFDLLPNSPFDITICHNGRRDSCHCVVFDQSDFSLTSVNNSAHVLQSLLMRLCPCYRGREWHCADSWRLTSTTSICRGAHIL